MTSSLAVVVGGNAMIPDSERMALDAATDVADNDVSFAAGYSMTCGN
jgi:hypothetical protein